MWLILTKEETSRCQGKIRIATQSQSGLPQWAAPPSSRQGTVVQIARGLLGNLPFWTPWKLWKLGGARNPGAREPDAPKDGEPREPAQSKTWRECFLCVDRAWTARTKTRLSAIDLEGMVDDYDFFIRARETLRHARGGWLRCFVSWKSYNRIDLSQVCFRTLSRHKNTTNAWLLQFFFLFDNSDLVLTLDDKVQRAESLCSGYEYTISPEATQVGQLDPDIHMKIIGKVILEGLATPHLGRGSRTVLSGIPKRPAPPVLARKARASGWAFHAGQGLCPRRILYWTHAIIAFGVAFVPFWLGSIKELDLQNAFAPVTFLATLVMLWLCIAALAHTV